MTSADDQGGQGPLSRRLVLVGLLGSIPVAAGGCRSTRHPTMRQPSQ